MDLIPFHCSAMPKAFVNQKRDTRLKKVIASFHGGKRLHLQASKTQTQSIPVPKRIPRAVPETAVSIMQRGLTQLATVIDETGDASLMEACLLVRNILVDEQALVRGTRSRVYLDVDVRREKVPKDNKIAETVEKAAIALVRACTARPTLNISKAADGDTTWMFVSGGFGSLMIDFDYGVASVQCFDPDLGSHDTWAWCEVADMKAWWFGTGITTTSTSTRNTFKSVSAFVWKTWNNCTGAFVQKTLSVVIAVAYMLQLEKSKLSLPQGVFVTYGDARRLRSVSCAMEAVRRMPRYMFAAAFKTRSNCMCEECKEIYGGDDHRHGTPASANITIEALLTARGFEVRSPASKPSALDGSWQFETVAESVTDGERFKSKHGIAAFVTGINYYVRSKAERNLRDHCQLEEFVGMTLCRFVPFF